jgi:hypothetical protein
MRSLPSAKSYLPYVLLGWCACIQSPKARQAAASDRGDTSAPDVPDAGTSDAGTSGASTPDTKAPNTGTPDAARADANKTGDVPIPAERGADGRADAAAERQADDAAAHASQSCASEPLRSTGQIHYVCDCQSGADGKCTAGSDNNNGLSPSSPLQSFSKAASTFRSMKAGETMALCRGGRWNVKTGAGFANSACQKASTCDLRDYAPPWGDGSESLPSVWLDGGSAGATLMTFLHAAQHFEGFRVLNLDLHGSGTDNGIFFYNETTDVDLCNLTMDGFAISVQMGGGDSPTFGLQSNIVLRSSRITNNTNIAYLASCDHCAIEDSYFDNDGARSATTHSIYFASQSYKVNGQFVVHAPQGMRLSRSEIHYSTQQCRGAPVVVHGRHQDVVIENNIIDAASAADGCWGPGVGCGAYPYGCWFRNVSIRGNTFRNLGNVASDNSQCTGCTIENNLFVMNRGGTGVSLGNTPSRPTGDSTYTEWDGSPDDPTSNVTVRNNTFYIQDAASASYAISIYSGTGHVIENNAIAFAGGKVATSACYRLPSNPTATVAAADYNLCNLPAGGGWAAYAPKYGTPLADWQAAGFEKHALQTDPLLSNPPQSFVPAAGSPLIDAADASACPKDDLTGKLRDPKPDIGAFER